MKRILLFSAILLTLGTGCQKNNQQTADRIAKLEKRIEVLEKRLTAATPPARKAPAAQTSPYEIPIGKSYVWGNPNAPVTITKFSDYQCPFCARAHESFVEKLFDAKVSS
jgi:protein-disulfide isomerase